MSRDPYFFTLLSPGANSSNRENLVEFDFFSQVPYELSPPKKTITSPDGTEEEDMLQWVEKGALIGRGWKVIEKNLSASDVSDKHNRLLISKQIVEEKIKPMMTIEEIEATRLNNNIVGGLGGGERRRGREHEGLEVTVYDNSGRDYLLYFIKWDSRLSPVLKGENYKEFRQVNCFAAGDLVEMWGFRDMADKLCFVVGKKLNLDLSL